MRNPSIVSTSITLKLSINCKKRIDTGKIKVTSNHSILISNQIEVIKKQPRANNEESQLNIMLPKLDTNIMGYELRDINNQTKPICNILRNIRWINTCIELDKNNLIIIRDNSSSSVSNIILNFKFFKDIRN